MNNLNSILLEGNLAREPELRYSPKGTPACTLVVASSRSYKHPENEGERVEEVSFLEATTHGKLATVCHEHLRKGRGLRVVGRIKQERWEDDAGNSRSKVVIIAEHVEFQPQPAPVPPSGTGNRCQLTRIGERAGRPPTTTVVPLNPAEQRSQALPQVGGIVMQNHSGSQRRRQERRENQRVERDRLTDVHALRAARECATIETAPMANMPTDQWERDQWGLSDE